MISIAMAAYNGEKYIKEQIDSILNQTFQDFELIVCDDCSADSTWSILQEYEQRDKRILCYLNEKNLGFNKNFEKAIGLCKGEYIAISDQDDIWTTDHLAVLLENIGNNLICCGDSMLVNENGECIYKHSEIFDNKILINTSAEQKVLRILYASNLFAGACMLIRKKGLQVMLPIPDSIRFYDAWFALYACVKSALIYIPNIVRYYRQHSSNAAGKHEKYTSRYLFKHFSSIIKYKSSDRPYCCIELLKRYKDMNREMKVILLSAEDYFRNKSNNFYRIKYLPFFIKNFPYIYLTKSKKMFFLRLIQYIFF
jgi:glycosyltransferase involved in cell wall biosynthesis